MPDSNQELTEAATKYALGTRHGKYKDLDESDKDKIRENIKTHGVESMLDAWEQTAPKGKPAEPRPTVEMTIQEKLAKIKDALASKESSMVKMAVVAAARIANDQKNWEFLGLMQELGIHMNLCEILEQPNESDDILECSLLCLASLSAGLNEEIRPVEAIVSAVVACLNRKSSSLICRQHGLCVLCNLSMSEGNHSALSGACVDLMENSIVVVLQKGDALSRSAATGLLCNLTGGGSAQDQMVEEAARACSIVEPIHLLAQDTEMSNECREAAGIVYRNLSVTHRSWLFDTNLGLLLPSAISLFLFFLYSYFRE